MLSSQKLGKPRTKSLVLTPVVAIMAFALAAVTPRYGYLLALLAMVAIILASWTGSFWPSQMKSENPWIFGLFWGLMIGLLLPFVLSQYVL